MEVECPTTEAQETVAAHKVRKEQHQRHRLRQHGSPCRTGNAPIQTEDEESIEHSVERHRYKRYVHRLFGIARHAEHIIQSVEEVGDSVTIEDNAHILARIGKCLVAGTEEVQQLVDIDQSEDHDRHTQHHVE